MIKIRIFKILLKHHRSKRFTSLSTENYKTLLREIKEDLNKCSDIPHS